MEEIKDRCISRKEYLKRNNSDVGYALYVQNNIKKDDYARFNTGEIVKVTGIRENQVNKKAIYFGAYDENWCDSAAVENFSENIIDLIEVGDIVELELSEEFVEREDKIVFTRIGDVYTKELLQRDIDNGIITKILSILTHEQYEANCYKVNTKITNLI